jgi:hypothetical protein
MKERGRSSTMTGTILSLIVVLVGLPLFAVIASNGPRR